MVYRNIFLSAVEVPPGTPTPADSSRALKYTEHDSLPYCIQFSILLNYHFHFMNISAEFL